MIMKVSDVGHSGKVALDEAFRHLSEVTMRSDQTYFSQSNLDECHNCPCSSHSCVHFLLSSVCIETLCFALKFPHL